MAALSLSAVSLRYGRGADVLRGFGHTFAPGATLLLGPNGAGESTVLGLAASALRPRAGQVRLGDLAACGRSLREFRLRVAWMPQRIEAFPGLSVREQVAYAGWLKGMSRAAAWASAVRALERVGLGGFEQRSPRRLSGGELRRVGLAQTLVHDAEWVLMDEPTAGLDPLQLDIVPSARQAAEQARRHRDLHPSDGGHRRELRHGRRARERHRPLRRADADILALGGASGRVAAAYRHALGDAP